MTLKKFLVLVTFFSATNAWSTTINKADNQFEVSLNDVKIISHTKDSPFLFIGNGDTTFEEHHGNFQVDDYISARIPLGKVFAVNGNTITLSALGDDALQVSVEFLETTKVFQSIKFSDLPAGYDRIWVRFIGEENEKIYGGGEQFTSMNMKGRAYPIWTREQGVGRNKSSLLTFLADTQAGDAGGDYHTTYYGEPTFISSRNYMVHSLSTYYTLLDFTHSEFHEVEVHAKLREMVVFGGQNYTIPEISQEYAKKQGLMPSLPDWVFNGAIIGVQGGTKKMLETLHKLEKHGVKVSALWIQDWAGRINTTFGSRVFWNWQWNSKQYPDLDKEIIKLKKRGVHVLVYLNPYLNIEGPLFKQADKLDLFVKNNSGQTFVSDFGEFFCGSVDLTNPAAVDWYQTNIIKPLLDLGVMGYMADFGEYLVVNNVTFHSGESALELHNKWPRLWAKLNREALEKYNKVGEVVFWMRAGYAGGSNYTTLMWAGDQNVDYTASDGLASTIPAALSIGLQGFGMTHFDIGGYTSLFGETRTKELFLRSAEAAVFTPVMRTHEGNRPTENWQLYSDDDTMKQFGRLVDIYTALSNYTKEAIEQYTVSGIPVQRALFYQYPDDKRSWSTEYQYMYGDDLLVAPVLKPNVDKWTCYLPPGNWIHLWSEKKFVGQMDITINAQLGEPPIFYKEDSKYDWTMLKLPLVPSSPPSTTEASGAYFIFALGYTVLIASLCILVC